MGFQSPSQVRQRSPKPLPGSMMNLQNSAHSHTQGYDLLQQNDANQNQQKERCMGQISKKPSTAQASKSSLPVESHRTCLVPPATNCDNMREMLSTRKLIRDSALKVFIASWSQRHSIPSMYQNSRFTQGKHLFSINHIIHTNSLGTVNHCYQNGMV